ncbi:P-loop containing nucleoside triphosphate hydrolase protein [Syncephalis plumigaleata]|nr:P-loop containing nucleoside triphosphate hydrolase protein [Syncephalis plumigaleata]
MLLTLQAIRLERARLANCYRHCGGYYYFSTQSVCYIGKQRVPLSVSSVRGQPVARNRPAQLLLEQRKQSRNEIETGVSDETLSAENEHANVSTTHFPIMAAATTAQMKKADQFFLRNRPNNNRVSGTEIKHFKSLYQPEVALLGRSNVGKSSLLNKLFQVNKLAQTSRNPGRTKVIDIYPAGTKMSVVDLPGYGRGSRVEWGSFILDYFKQRNELKRIYLLIDVRRGLMETDKHMISILDQIPVSYQIVFTKIDTIYDDTYYNTWRNTEEWLVQHAISCYPQLLGVSSTTGVGISELRYNMMITCGIAFK